MYKYKTYAQTLSAISKTPILDILNVACEALGKMIQSTTKHGVETFLEYWDAASPTVVAIDFTKPGGEAEYAKLQSKRSSRRVQIIDVRQTKQSFTLESNGFQYLDHNIPGLDGCKTEQEIIDKTVPVTEVMVRDRFKACRTIVFAQRIRCKASDDAQRADNRAPAHSVHSDFTPAGALQHLEATIGEDAERERLIRCRVYVVNVWRPLKTVTRDPLAVCDWKSVDPARDWIAHRFEFPHGWNELGAVKYHEHHQWYYLSHQTPTEPLVFVQFDGELAQAGGMTTAHSAFVDPDYVDEAARESIEIKMFVFVDRE